MEHWQPKKLEPGMLCMMVGCKNPENTGKVVRLISKVTEKTVGHRAVFEYEAINYMMGTDHIEWWEIDTPAVKIDPKRNYKYATPFAPAQQLMPIDGHEPDAEDLKLAIESTAVHNKRQPA